MGARILVVDDEQLILWTLSEALTKAGHVVERAETAAEALRVIQKEAPDLVLLDCRLPDRSGMEIMADLHRIAPLAPVIMITAHASLQGAVEATKRGVYDYISKPFEISDLMRTVDSALDSRRLREQVEWQRETAQRGHRLGDIIAHSPGMAEVVRVIRRVAESGASTVLITGESGVGKGLVARALHESSPACQEAFMDITCTSLSETLLESDLFGHEKGAFTDARTQKRGLLELADKGTVFLDEIGDITPKIQAKFLSFLEGRTFRRVGGTRDIQVSVRMIAATNKDLAKEVAEGRFREDLYYRLKVIPIPTPPLRERLADLPHLIERFIAQFNAQFGKTVRGIDEEAMAAMEAYPWPGNVRELTNAIERAVLLGDGDVLRLVDLPPEIDIEGGALPPPAAASGFSLPSEGVVLDEVERDLVFQALDRTGGNRARAARLLGMNRDQMRYRIKKFKLSKFM